MAPVEGRASSMHTTAGTALQYRHAQKLSDFIIGRARSLALFSESKNASNYPGCTFLQLGRLLIRCSRPNVRFILLHQLLTARYCPRTCPLGPRGNFSDWLRALTHGAHGAAKFQ